MPTDAKLGLLVGVGVVLAVAVVFFQKDPPPPAATIPAPVAQSRPPAAKPAPLPLSKSSDVPVIPVSRTEVPDE
jgi:hypothetical protein